MASGSLTLAQLPGELVADTGRPVRPGGRSVGRAAGAPVGGAKFAELLRRGRPLLARLYPSGRLSEDDYEFLFQTHGLPREVVTELAGELAS